MLKPAEFGSNTPRPSGTEVEYHVQEGRKLPEATRIEYLQEIGIAIVSTFLSNGGRLYEYDGLELCTPECTNPKTTAKAEFKGIDIMRAVTNIPKISAEEWATMSKEQRAFEQKRQFPVLRLSGSYDPKEDRVNTRGYHQNLLFPWPKDVAKVQRLKRVMDSYLATRLIWDGAGMPVKGNYLLSQKAPGIGATVTVENYGSRTAHGNKPLAAMHNGNNSHEGARDKLSPGWGLLEIRSADVHMSQTRTFVSLAGTSLLMRLVEQDYINEDNEHEFIIAEDPIETLHELNKNHGRGLLTHTVNGETKTITAAGLQEYYFTAALNFGEREPLHESELTAGHELVRINQKLGSFLVDKALRPLVRDVEWAAKEHYLGLEQAHKQYTGDNIAQQKLEDAAWYHLLWHSADEDSIGLHKYAKLDPLHQMPDEAIDPASRAVARGAAVASGRFEDITWNKLTRDYKTIIHLDDYWRTDLPKPA